MKRMKIDGLLEFDVTDRDSVARNAALAASIGYDRLFSSETAHDPFLPVALAAGCADIDLGTNIAVAFARNPMSTAMVARDLNELSGGRFILGLGSQIKPHITRRFSMPWSHPAARMREFILAMRTIWDYWQGESRQLDFRGEFYQHTLSNTLFEPEPARHGIPRIFLAGVGPLMTEVAGEVADGLLCHVFTTPSYIAEVTRPALRRGMEKAHCAEDSFELTVPVMVVSGGEDYDPAPDLERVRRQIAFYGSTPAYLGVLKHHGWEALHDELHRLSKEQRWADMMHLIDDDMLNTFAVVAEPEDLSNELRRRYGKLVNALSLKVPYTRDPETWMKIFAELKAGE